MPFTCLGTNLNETAPSWRVFPPGIEAAVVPTQPIESSPPRLALRPAMVRYTLSPTNRYSIDLRGTFAEYLQKFSAKQRYNLAREVRKFAEFSGGKIDCRTFLSADEMKEFYRYGNQISANSWKRELGGPGLSGTVPETEALRLAETCLARGYVLFHEQKPVAYVFCHAKHEHLMYRHIGYDQKYAKWSPGTVLLYLILERLFAEHRHEHLDLGEGTQAYKSFFSTHCVRCVRVFYFRRTLRNFAIVGAHCALTKASIALGQVMRRLGLKQKIKRVLMGKMYRAGNEETRVSRVPE